MRNQNAIESVSRIADRLTPRNEEQNLRKNELLRTIGELQARLTAPIDEVELQLVDGKIDEARQQALKLMKEMSPSNRVFLFADGIPIPEQIPSLPGRYEYIVSGDFVLETASGTKITIKHGTTIQARSLSGYNVLLTLPGDVEIFIPKKDLPIDGIHIESGQTGDLGGYDSEGG